MEKEHKSVITGVLLGLSLLTALLLESRINSGISAQLTLIFLGILVSGAVLFGLMMYRNWAYPLGALVFLLSLANLMWLFSMTKSVLGLAFGILVNIVGLVLCLAVISGEQKPSLETYELGSMGNLETPRRRGRPRKTVYSNF